MENDKLLYKQFLDGNIKAFEELVLSHKDHLIYFLQRYIKDIAACEDVAQDVFAYVFVYKEKYDQVHSFKTFLYTLAKNKAIDYIRKQSRIVPNQELMEAASDGTTDGDELFSRVVQDENARMVHDCLKKLSVDYQTCIHLVDFEELSYKEASTVMNRSVPQFKVLLFRARKALKLLLEKGGYTHEG